VNCTWARLLAEHNKKGLMCSEVGHFNFSRRFKTPRRIGLVIRGESFRSGSGQGDHNDTVSHDGYQWQILASKSHLDQVILPIERCGLNVDVFVGTYSHQGSKASRHPDKELLGFYGDRVRSSFMVPSSRKRLAFANGSSQGDWGAATMYEESLRLVRQYHFEHPAAYEAVLVIRHDSIFKAPLTSFQDAEWHKVLFPFAEKLAADSVSDVLQWIPWRYVNCASGCGYRGHGLGACIREKIGDDNVAFFVPGVHTSNTEVETNPLYALARPLNEEKRIAVLLVGDVGRMVEADVHKKGPYVPLRVTGRSFEKHVLEPNNRQFLDLHKHLDVIVHGWVPGLERIVRKSFPSIVRSNYTPMGDFESVLRERFGGGLDDLREAAWAYSLKQAVELMREVELEKRIRYSYVLVYQPDVLLLKDIDVKKTVAKDAVYRTRGTPLHLATTRALALELAKLYERLPLQPSTSGKGWLQEFVEGTLGVEFIEDEIEAGLDEEVYWKIPRSMRHHCNQAVFRRMADVGLTAEDLKALGFDCLK